jgi:hypothetical protein
MRSHRLQLSIILLILFTSLANGQNTLVLDGTVTDSEGETLPGATVLIIEKGKGTNTDLNGNFSFKLEPGKYNLQCRFIGYTTVNKTIKLSENTTLNFVLETEQIQIKEFQVYGTQTENTESVRMSDISLNIEQINQIPQFLGEVDIIKTIQFLPGVSSAAEGTSGFYVRGGGPDQNLILLDGAVVYNSSHLFGFFSVFNSSAVDNITLVKGGMPAKYGGRLSSVLDITQRSGSTRKFEVEGSIGTISSKISIGGPIVKDKTSFRFSARRTYIDVLIAPFISDTSNFSGTAYFFYDLNGRIDHSFNEKNKISFSGYYGIDKFKFNDNEVGFELDIPWGNATAGLSWLHTFNSEFFIKTSLNYSHYEFSFNGQQNQFEFQLLSGIDDWNLQSDGFYKLNSRHILRFGVQGTYHRFTPSSVSARSGETEFDTGGIQRLYGLETGAYISDEWDATEQLKLYGGLRFSTFSQFGPFTRYTKNDRGQTVDSKTWDRGETVSFYPRIEPRFSVRYKTGKESSIKAAYTLNFQYIQLASISPISLPTDVWVPSSDRIEPQRSDQVNLGYFINLKDHMYEASAEIYYKWMGNLVEYADGAEAANDINDNADNQLVVGDGYSYGLELFFKKVQGKFNGWVGYTLSFSNRIFPDINNGKEFPARFDRRHDLSLIANYTINNHWSLGGAFVYATGNAITLPQSRYLIENTVVNEYAPRNSNRMADYNRLDLSVTYTPKNAKRVLNAETGEITMIPRKFKSKFNFSIYNVYNRANPYFIYFDNEVDAEAGTVTTQAKQVSLFPILPAITWNFEF